MIGLPRTLEKLRRDGVEQRARNQDKFVEDQMQFVGFVFAGRQDLSFKERRGFRSGLIA